jgi:hypothetical protein
MRYLLRVKRLLKRTAWAISVSEPTVNEHIYRGNKALEKKDYVVAAAEFTLALAVPDTLVQTIAKNRLSEIAEVLESAPKRIGSWTEAFPPVTRSRCCNARALFVRSREGGYVSKNCTACMKSDYAHKSDFPFFAHCDREFGVTLIDKNYHYRCPACGITIAVPDNVPMWSELFPYDPLVAPGDPGWSSWG